MYRSVLCIHVHLFLVFAFRDTRFLSGLYDRFSYIVTAAVHQRLYFRPGTVPDSNGDLSKVRRTRPQDCVCCYLLSSELGDGATVS
jgi:hypothetical protein